MKVREQTIAALTDATRAGETTVTLHGTTWTRDAQGWSSPFGGDPRGNHWLWHVLGIDEHGEPIENARR